MKLMKLGQAVILLGIAFCCCDSDAAQVFGLGIAFIGLILSVNGYIDKWN